MDRKTEVFRDTGLHDSQLERRMLETPLMKLIYDWFRVYYAHGAIVASLIHSDAHTCTVAD